MGGALSRLALDSKIFGKGRIEIFLARGPRLAAQDGPFTATCFPSLWLKAYLQLPGETTTMSRTVWIWAAVLAVIGIVLASIDRAGRTDPNDS